jgi:hypothetical protein
VSATVETDCPTLTSCLSDSRATLDFFRNQGERHLKGGTDLGSVGVLSEERYSGMDGANSGCGDKTRP